MRIEIEEELEDDDGVSPIDAYIVLAAFAKCDDLPTLNFIAMLETFLQTNPKGWEKIQEKVEDVSEDIMSTRCMS